MALAYPSFRTAEPLSPYLPENLRRGLVLYLWMNEGAGDRVYDLSGNGNHGTIYGATWTRLASGKNALYFDGVDDYVDCGNAPSLNTFSSITITVLAKQMRWTGGLDAWVLDKDYTGYRIWGLDRHRAMFRSPTQDWQTVDGGSVPELNRWYHLTAVYDGDALMLRLYRDGVLVAQSASSEKLNFGFSGVPLRLGRHSVDSKFYPVVIGYVAIYNRALSDAEIRTLYNLHRGLFVG
ncbi:MAG: LamG domain-containing protein [Thermofilaceae archaeon]